MPLRRAASCATSPSCAGTVHVLTRLNLLPVRFIAQPATKWWTCWDLNPGAPTYPTAVYKLVHRFGFHPRVQPVTACPVAYPALVSRAVAGGRTLQRLWKDGRRWPPQALPFYWLGENNLRIHEAGAGQEGVRVSHRGGEVNVVSIYFVTLLGSSQSLLAGDKIQ